MYYSKQPQQPKLNHEDSLISETSMTLNSYRDSDVQPYRQVSIGPNRASVPANFFNQKAHIEETPRSNCSLTPTHANDALYESQSNSSSQVFKQGRIIPKTRKANDEMEFEYGGQVYQVDIGDDLLSPRDNLFQPNQVVNLNDEDHNDISPIFEGSQEDDRQQPKSEENKHFILDKPKQYSDIDLNQQTPSFSEQLFLRQKKFDDKQIQADLVPDLPKISIIDSSSGQDPQNTTTQKKVGETPVVDTYYQDIAAQLAAEIEEEERKEKEREEEEKRKQDSQNIQQSKQEEVDTYYADIAAQLAAEIEMEELQQKQEEEKENQIKEVAKKVDFSSSPSRNTPQQIEQVQPYARDKTIDKKGDPLDDIMAPKIQRYTTSFDHHKYSRKQTNENAQKLENENKMLQQQLRETQKQLKEINSQFIDQQNVADAKLHLAFLFASPLVMRCQGNAKNENFTSMLQLEFKREFKEITQSLKNTEMKINIKKIQATVDNLTQILAQNPISLHFSGHGIENTPRFLGRDYYLKKDEGNFLVFESEDGEGELISEKKLSEFMKQANSNLEFVFVASCNSEPVGQIFKNAGAKHVICVKNGQEIADEAVITFSKSFYHSVFSQSKMTICQSFNMAKKLVEQKFGIGEANKFSLLNQSSNSSPSKLYSSLAFRNMPSITESPNNTESHKCKVFGPLKKGSLTVVDKQGRFKQYPAKVDNFIGRQTEMHKVVRTVCLNRLVNIIGLPGIGKTALSKNVVHYINERNIFKSGILFLPLKGIMNCEIFFKKLLAGFLKENFQLDKDQLKDINEGSSEFLLKMALQYLREQEDNLLIVFDNVEDLLHHDKKTFRNLINDLLVNCPLIHIMMTSRLTLGALQDIQEKVVVLQELNVNFSIKLFTIRSREISDQEIQELLEYSTERSGNSDSLDKKVNSLNDHHLFKLLSGNPHAIILAAPMLLKIKLKELYMLLNSKEMHEILSVDGITDSTVASLRLSLEASIQLLEKEDKESLEFFFMIGLLPGGVSDEDLNDIWGDNWEQFVDKLLNFSLLQKKEQGEEQKEKYILPPFMNNYAEAKISDDLKIKFQNEICRHYAIVCKKILDQNQRSYKKPNKRQSELNHQVMKKLLNHESNIWNCIYRMVDTNGLLSQSTGSEGEEHKDEEGRQARIQRFSTMFELKNENQHEIKSQSTLFKRAQKNKTELFGKQVTSSSSNEQQIPEDALNNYKLIGASQASELDVRSVNRPQQLMMSASMRRNSLIPDQIPPVLTKDALKALQMEQQAPERSSNPIDLEEIEEKDSFASDDSMHQIEEAKKIEEKQQQKANKLKEIERNSNVHFQRQSNTKNFLQKMQKADQNNIFAKAGTQVMQPQLPPLNMKKDLSTKQDDLIYAEKLVLYYTLNLYLLREMENSLNIIEEYGFKIKGSLLYEANLKKIQALCYLNMNENDKSLNHLQMALEKFSQLKCQYGMALCYFGIGFIYYTKGGTLKNQQNDDAQYQNARTYFLHSLKLFEKVNHLVGQGQCHRYLSLIYSKFHNKTLQKQHQENMRKLSKYNTICKDTPFIPRVHGLEISLLIEVVHETLATDLYSKRVIKKKQSSNNQYLTPQTVIPPLEITHQNSAPVLDEDSIPFEAMQPFKFDTENYDDNYFQKVITIESEQSPRNEFSIAREPRIPQATMLGEQKKKELDVVLEEEQSEMQTSFYHQTQHDQYNEYLEFERGTSRNTFEQYSQGDVQNSGRSSLSGKSLINDKIFTPQKGRQDTSLFKVTKERKDTIE